MSYQNCNEHYSSTVCYRCEQESRRRELEKVLKSISKLQDALLTVIKEQQKPWWKKIL